MSQTSRSALAESRVAFPSVDFRLSTRLRLVRRTQPRSAQHLKPRQCQDGTFGKLWPSFEATNAPGNAYNFRAVRSSPP